MLLSIEYGTGWKWDISTDFRNGFLYRRDVTDLSSRGVGIHSQMIERFGVYRILILGAVFNLICVIINLTGTTLYNYWIALFLLGVGWNFLFIGATSLLTECYQDSEKALVQAVNEFSVLLTVSVCSLSSGLLMEFFGWKILNLISLPPIILILGASLWLLYRHSLAISPRPE